MITDVAALLFDFVAFLPLLFGGFCFLSLLIITMHSLGSNNVLLTHLNIPMCFSEMAQMRKDFAKQLQEQEVGFFNATPSISWGCIPLKYQRLILH
jgi:hypothetical protein